MTCLPSAVSWRRFSSTLKRHALSDGKENLKTLFARAKETSDAGYIGIEFVRGGTTEQFFADAATLKEILSEI